MNLNISTPAKGSARPSSFSSIPQNHASIPKENSMTRKHYESIKCERIWCLCVDRGFIDVRISLMGNFGRIYESTTAICSSHHFILVSRSSYFHTALISWPSPKTQQPKPTRTSHAYSSIAPLYSCITAFHSELNLYRHSHLLSQNLRSFHQFRNPSLSSLSLANNSRYKPISCPVTKRTF
jgi:hypothetical protein